MCPWAPVTACDAGLAAVTRPFLLQALSQPSVCMWGAGTGHHTLILSQPLEGLQEKTHLEPFFQGLLREHQAAGAEPRPGDTHSCFGVSVPSAPHASHVSHFWGSVCMCVCELCLCVSVYATCFPVSLCFCVSTCLYVYMSVCLCLYVSGGG